MLSREQLALVHVAKRELGLSDETYRDILHVETGVDSSRDLDSKGLDRLLARFAEMGFEPGHSDGRRRAKRRRATVAPDPHELPTPGQKGMLAHLWKDVGWPPGDRRLAFSKRVCAGHPWPQTRGEANDLIEALKAMVKRGYSDRVPRTPRRRAVPQTPASGG